MHELAALRAWMVREQLAARGIEAPLVLAAMRKVPREAFIPARLRARAYEDAPLPIAAGQTISQPYIVALMIQALALRGGESVLEIGTGSGYAAAVLAQIAGQVCTVERIGALADAAAATLAGLGYGNVQVRHADGSQGWPGLAPYDAIIVTAGGPEIPPSLKAQLKIGGRLVMPVGASPHAQALICLTRHAGDVFSREVLADVRFVPLIGAEAWPEADSPPQPRRG